MGLTSPPTRRRYRKKGRRCGDEGGIRQREGDVEMKEILKDGRERRELQGVRNLRERYIMYVEGEGNSVLK